MLSQHLATIAESQCNVELNDFFMEQVLLMIIFIKTQMTTGYHITSWILYRYYCFLTQSNLKNLLLTTSLLRPHFWDLFCQICCIKVKRPSVDSCLNIGVLMVILRLRFDCICILKKTVSTLKKINTKNACSRQFSKTQCK